MNPLEGQSEIKRDFFLGVFLQEISAVLEMKLLEAWLKNIPTAQS